LVGTVNGGVEVHGIGGTLSQVQIRDADITFSGFSKLLCASFEYAMTVIDQIRSSR
jgi:hypothetical protein